MTLFIDSTRHDSVKHFKELFEYGHLSPELQNISRRCCDLAQQMIDSLSDGPELTAGLRKLLEAKDCFVRQARIKKAGQ